MDYARTLWIEYYFDFIVRAFLFLCIAKIRNELCSFGAQCNIIHDEISAVSEIVFINDNSLN